MADDPVCYETPRSRKFRQDAASGALAREWVVLGTDDVLEARDLVLVNNPASFLGLSRKSIEMDSLGAPDLWSAAVQYGVSALPDGLKPDELSFNITTQSVHITNSLETLYRLTEADSASGTNLTVDASTNTDVAPDGYTPVAGDVGKTITITPAPPTWVGGTYTIISIVGGKWRLNTSPAAVGATGGKWGIVVTPPGTATDHKGAIGVDLDTVHGCDILVPKMEFTFSRQRETVTFDYIRTLRSLVGKTNNDTFYGFAAHSLLYLGANPSSAYGTLDDGTKFLFWNLSHSFAMEEQKTNAKIGAITVPVKDGFAYLWAQYARTKDLASNLFGTRPSAVYVERVYDEADYGLLEIGT